MTLIVTDPHMLSEKNLNKIIVFPRHALIGYCQIWAVETIWYLYFTRPLLFCEGADGDRLPEKMSVIVA